MLTVNQLAGFGAKPAAAGAGGGITKRQFITSGTSFVTPADWNNANNTVEAIGGGSTGGGAYAKVTNLTLSGTVTCQVGAGSSGTGTGTDSWISNTGVAPTTTSEGVLAKGAVGHTGGLTATSIGSTKFAGGSSTNADCVGGGGAGGPHGAGANGATSPTDLGGGGGGSDGGGNGNTNGTGGTNRLGTGGGIKGTPSDPDAGDGSGGGGGGGGYMIDDAQGGGGD